MNSCNLKLNVLKEFSIPLMAQKMCVLAPRLWCLLGHLLAKATTIEDEDEEWEDLDDDEMDTDDQNADTEEYVEQNMPKPPTLCQEAAQK
jgi:hypothetical protein